MPTESAIWAVVPAAGVGSRMRSGVPKQYLLLLGRPVVLHALERLCTHPRVRGVFVGVAPQDIYWSKVAGTCSHWPKFLGAFDGGISRSQTVLNGLAAVAAHAHADDWVLIHDAARPCVRAADIDKLIAVDVRREDGALLAVPVTDTVKRVDTREQVLETMPRDGLWRALTPQMFGVDALRWALGAALQAGVAITDDAGAIERMGGKPRVVAGHPDNLKITVPTDLDLAELFIKRQQGEST